MDMAKDLTLDMFEDGLYKKIAAAIGPKNFVELAKIVGGSTIYIPKPESLTRPVRDARIKDEFNGYNHLELARKYDVTVRWVQQLCGEGHPEGQLSLLDFIPEKHPDGDNNS